MTWNPWELRKRVRLYRAIATDLQQQMGECRDRYSQELRAMSAALNTARGRNREDTAKIVDLTDEVHRLRHQLTKQHNHILALEAKVAAKAGL